MPAQAHVAIQGDSPTPLHAHQHAPTPSLQHLTGEVLATAHLLQQQVRTLECLAHATEEREATLAQQRAKLQELLRLVTQMETAEIRATASLRDTLARVHAGRDRSAAASLSFAALRLAASTGLGEGSSTVPPSPLGGSGISMKNGGGGGGGEDRVDPVDNPDPEGTTDPKDDVEACEAHGGGEGVGQRGEGEGMNGASKADETGSGAGGNGDAEDASQPLPQFASLRVRSEEGECGCDEDSSKEDHGAPQGEGDVGVPLPLAKADATASPGASASVSRLMDQDRRGGNGQATVGTELGAGRLDALGLKQAQGAEDGEEGLASDSRPENALARATGRQAEGAPMPSRQGNEPMEMRKAAAGSEGSWRACRRMPEWNAKEQMKGGE